MKKICIIKLGAKGDVIRTLPILKGIKKLHSDSEIVWITKSNIKDLIENNPLISKTVTIPFSTEEKFDILYNFDIEEEATSLAKKINANKKYGFYQQDGFAIAFNLGAEYYLNTLYDDSLKKTNKKTYQEMMFETAEIPYEKQHEKIYLTEDDKKFANEFLEAKNLQGKKIIGIHMGSGPRWPSKAWSESKIKEFIKEARKKSYEIILFGGPDEKDTHEKFVKELNENGLAIHQNNLENSNREFTALISLCDKVICSDSFALHVAIALDKETIALFFCSPPNEVEGYDLLTKISSSKLYDFFPEKMDQYSAELVNSITVNEVLQELN